MDTTEKINEILEKRYNNYKGSLFNPIKFYHAQLRLVISDEDFLKFLKEQETNNPRPVLDLDKFIKENNINVK